MLLNNAWVCAEPRGKRRDELWMWVRHVVSSTRPADLTLRRNSRDYSQRKTGRSTQRHTIGHYCFRIHTSWEVLRCPLSALFITQAVDGACRQNFCIDPSPECATEEHRTRVERARGEGCLRNAGDVARRRQVEMQLVGGKKKKKVLRASYTWLWGAL